MRKVLAFAARAAISLALLYFAIGRANLGMLMERLRQIDMIWLLAAASLVLIQVFVLALRWREIAMRCEARTPLPRMLKFALIGYFFNQTLPSTVGGDAARIWLLARDGAGWAKAAYSVVIDRAAGLLMLALIVVACMPWSFDLIRDPVGRATMWLIGIGCVVGPAAFVALGYRSWPLLDRFWLTRHVAEAARVAHAVAASPRSGGFIVAVSLLIHAMTFLAVWCIAKSVAAPFELVHALLLIPPVLLVATIPISIGGWGVRESAMVLAFAYVGLPEGDGLLVSVLLGALMFAVGMIGGLIWLASPGGVRGSEPPRP